jgi:hypothetical protein
MYGVKEEKIGESRREKEELANVGDDKRKMGKRVIGSKTTEKLKIINLQ